MHNRHFAVSMTIGGEKVAAFSAISLNLPPFTTDYSSQIIAHSRAQYTQSRDFIERYVAGRYLTEDQPAKQPKQQPQQSKPRPAQPAPPVSAPAAPPAVTSEPAATAASESNSPTTVLSHVALEGATPPSTGQEEVKPKRKRTRRRKRKSTDGAAPAGPTTAQVAKAIEEGVIRLN
jgi:hypothetical protein